MIFNSTQLQEMKTVFMKFKKLSSLKPLTLALCCTSFFLTVKAGIPSGILDIHGVTLTGVAADAVHNTQPLGVNQTAVVDYSTYLPIQTTQVDQKIKNIITFSIKEEAQQFITQDFSATIDVKIEYGNNSSSLNTITQTFTVNYTKAEGAKYNAKKYFSFDNAKYVKITILSSNYSIPVIGSLDTRDVLMLDNQMQITRYFELPTTVPSPVLSFTSPTDPIPDHLAVNWAWPVNTGNNATQLEWVWIENEMADLYKISGTFNDGLIFKNATRVDLPLDKIQYDIPLLYDGSGQLFYRVRAVNFKDDGNRTDGPWSLSNNYSFLGHNNNLNWQATTTFAEDGKRKTMVQYYDGTLRPRQTVTKDNSTNTVVTAESFYDAQGRAAIQILPTPGITNIIQYQANLNLFNGQAANQDPAELFDMEPVSTPNSLTPSLATTSGTSKYYSPANILDKSSIPDAEGYPYTVTRYTPDATGRELMRSGVGVAQKMGNGHEVKYYYGTPAQEELDGLFGTEVGNYTHYAKNMVKDANGQMSVSYVDMHGRTIATALAGESPTNLLALNKTSAIDYPNQAGTNIVRNLLDNSTNVIKGNGVESINSLLVPASTQYNFTYQLSPQALQVAACSGANPATLCYDCLYDLEIAITDESSDNPMTPIIKKFSNVSLNPDDNCNTATPAFTDLSNNNISNTITFNQTLQPGSYTVRKTLSISQSSFQYYKDLYMSKAMCKTEQQVIDSVYNVLLGTSDCANTTAMTCQSCLTNLGTEATYRLNYLTSIGLTSSQATPQIENDVHSAYLKAQQNCNRLCNNVDQSLSTIRQLMLLDMVPYSGQYATADATGNTIGGVHTMFDKYNVFSTVSSSTQPFYKFPWNTNKVKDFYYDNQNNKDVAIHPEVSPAIDYTFLNATTPNNFEQSFKNSWANALLPHHPEYDRLVYAETYLTPSYNWINTFTQTDDFTTAQTNGYTNPVANDPFFTIASSSYTTNMNSAIANYQGMGVSMWQLAYGDVNCKSVSDIAARQACYTSAPTTPPPYSGFTTAQNAQAWQVFRGLYAAVRNNYVNKFIADTKPLQAGTDENDLITQNYRLWFPRSNEQSAAQNQWSWWPTTVGGPPTGVNPATDPGTYNNRCNSYIDTWKTRLLQCAALASRPDKDAILTQIVTRMQAVCVNGSNADNPYGASNVAPATPSSVADRSFEDVIKNVFSSYGIINSNGVYTDDYCNPFVIEWPKPYGKGPQLVGGELATQVDTCNCKAFAKITTEATAHGYDATLLSSLNQYLQAQYGETLTQGLFDGLQHCSSMYHDTCIIVNTTIQYNCSDPEPLCPDSSNNDLTNNSIKQLQNNGAVKAVNNFKQPKANEPGIIRPPQPLYTCDALNNLIKSFCFSPIIHSRDQFVQYFNNNYNTLYTWDQIAQIYLNSCGYGISICSAITPEFGCDELEAVKENYNSTIHDATKSCQDNFTDYFNNYYGTSYTWDEIAQLYIDNCEVLLNICAMSFDCTELENVRDGFRLSLSDSKGCQGQFVDYFNGYYGTSYTWDQIVQLYTDNCQITLDVCGDAFNCSELERLKAKYNSTIHDKTKSCQDNFTSYFNTYYGTAYTWGQIVQLYLNNCNINLQSDVCVSYCNKICSKTTCSTIYTGPYTLPIPQPLPDFLKCGYVKNAHCISCAGLSSLTAEYKTVFTTQPNTAPIFTGTNLTPDQLQYNMNYARFINYRTGFQFGWMDYAQAAANAAPACNLDNYSSNGSASQNVICGNAHALTDALPVTPETPCQKVYTMATALGQQLYQTRQQILLQQFEDAYRAKCLAAKDMEQFTVAYGTSEYHYTLYYYDMAGNLVKTVPPKGVRPDFSTAYTTQVEIDRTNDVANTRPHQLVTEYRYNSLGQVVAQQTPDAGTSSFWYDRLGRLVVSQNAQQAIDNNYSYTKFDVLGRISEVGQKPQTAGSMTQTISQDDIALINWLDNSGGTKNQITRTTYDVIAVNINPPPTPAILTQQNLRNKVSYTQLFDTDPGTDPFAHQSATYYTYDVHGNVDKLVQDYKGITAMSVTADRFKLMAYDYDLISGKVNMVSYQPGMADAFYHKYNYDAENRITEVLTSRDKMVWESDARYDYYRHGPLARTELGQLKVQGNDYSYTLQGWLKGVNNTALNPAQDMMGDGTSQTSAAKDVLSYALHYFDETVGGNSFIDYKPIAGTSAFARPGTAANISSLYNGNIAAMTVNNAGLAKNTAANNNSLPLLYNYRYDQLNRIVSMQAYKGLDAATNQWTVVSINDYKENVSYDPNGNIKTYTRNGDANRLNMDDLKYYYYYYDASNVKQQYDPTTAIPAGAKTLTNQLAQVTDAAADASSGNYANYNDIKQGQSTGNYTFDAIGNLKSDVSEGISNITWTVYGKIKSITKATGTIAYTYDASGNRVSKNYNGTTTVYTRDATGNTMAVYEVSAIGNVLLKENHLYGSGRIGMVNQLTVSSQSTVLATGFGNGIFSTFTRGEKVFELSNHLGNVLVTVSDKKIAVSSNSSTIDYYTADVITAGDYYPFGMQMPGRKFAQVNSSYRYGFNGQEKSDEIAAGLTTAMFWEYDSRIGRRWNIDPVVKVWESSYLCFSGNPIMLTDYLGNDATDNGRKKGKNNPPPKVITLDAVIIYSPMKNYSHKISNFLRSYYEDVHNENLNSILEDLAKDLGEKILDHVGLNDIQSPKTPGEIIIEQVKKLGGAEMKELNEIVETMAKNVGTGSYDDQLRGLMAVGKGMLEKRMGGALVKALEYFFKVTDDYINKEIVFPNNILTVDGLEAQKTTLQFETFVKRNMTKSNVRGENNLIKEDHIYVMAITRKQLTEIMNTGFFIPQNSPKQFGIWEFGNSGSSEPINKAYFNGGIPAYYIYFNQTYLKGYLRKEEIGVFPILTQPGSSIF